MTDTQCPMCGGDLKDEVGACSKCPVGSGCDMLCCDRCGYRTVAPRSKVIDLFKRFLGRQGQDRGEVKSDGA